MLEAMPHENWWTRLRETLQGGVRQQVTAFGLLFSGAIVVVGLAAFLSANNLIFLVLSAMLATMLLSGFVSRLSLTNLRLEFLLPEHVSARTRTQGRVIVENEKRWMPSFSLHLARVTPGSKQTESYLFFPYLAGGGRLEAPLDLVFPRRGTETDNRFVFVTRFPFGFTERRIAVPVKQHILVYPCLTPRPEYEDLYADVAGEIEARERGQGHDFYRIRPYEFTDPARHIDWRASAHTGDLQIREFTRTADRSVFIYLDLRIDGRHLEWFERAVECAAYLCWRLTEQGRPVEFRTQDFSFHTPEQGEVYVILKYLATVEPGPRSAPTDPDDRDTLSILLSSAAQPAWRGRVVGAGELGGGAEPGPGAGENLHHR
jgi:uncharacterized protein (DUF58 family)